jgi:predicted porin
MNNKIKLAVAGAVLASASVANAGIVIPAGDWTLDVNGNVNAFATIMSMDDANTITGSVLGPAQDSAGESDNQHINTGLLPAWLGFTGTTRQNDVDVSFTISMQPNVSDNSSAGDNKTPLNRQAFLTFGDKSWGSFKLGKDIGIYAQDAILNDMTLLGVGGGFANSGNATTLGGIGSGYIYAAWKGQVAYTTPNMNGFQATLGITNPNQIDSDDTAGQAAYQDSFGFEGKASYSFGGDFSGKIWGGFARYQVTHDTAAASYDVDAYDVGATISAGNAGLTAYLYGGEGVGITFLGYQGATSAGVERDGDGGYIQATYVIPTGTKMGIAYGVSKLDLGAAEASSALVKEQKRWTVGAYHPLTKHLNLVAEYNDMEVSSHSGLVNEGDALSLGAILFF